MARKPVKKPKAKIPAKPSLPEMNTMPIEHPFDPELIRATTEKFATPVLAFEIETTAAPGDQSRLRTNPPDAIQRRLARMGVATPPATSTQEMFEAKSFAIAPTLESPASEFSFVIPAPPPPVEPVGLERIIGKNMLMEVRYLEAGERAAKSVGRIVIGGKSGRIAGYGTGFLVGPGLLLTNNHVLGTAADAAGSTVEFDYQRGVDRTALPSSVAALDPTIFFATDKALDFTLVGVREPTGKSLASFGYLPLVAIADEILAGECVSIIQHPNGEPKQVALRENEVLELPAPGEPFLRYKTDTMPGSSGSPVFNDQWEVVALHHSGWPSTDAAGNYLTPDGTIWRKEMGEQRIHWKGNEGVRVAAIVEHLKKLNVNADQKRRLAGAFGSQVVGPTVPTPIVQQPKITPKEDIVQQTQSTPVAPVVSPGGEVTITIPVQITVRVGGAIAPTAGSDGGRDASEKVVIDSDYSNRTGYDPAFLGTGARRVPFPKLTEEQLADAAINKRAGSGENKHELLYHHYSVVIKSSRRLPYFTAVNIDGDSLKLRELPEREGDAWSLDPRIEPHHQYGNGLYKGMGLDRGHLVRRLDPAWGKSLAVAEQAVNDTFHFTNCSPQHPKFNRGKKIWAGLEDYVLKTQADGENRRICVFTGPVFGDNDPIIKFPDQGGVEGRARIPTEYWKVVIMVKPSGQLTAAGFLVTQERFVRPMADEAAIDVARTYQVKITKIEELTGLDFGKLRKLDPLLTSGGLERLEAESTPAPLEDYEAIEL